MLGSVPSMGKRPFLQCQSGAGDFSLFWLRRGGQCLLLHHEDRRGEFSRGVKLLARKAGVEIEERQLTPAERQAQSELEQFRRINRLAAEFYRTSLMQAPEGGVARKIPRGAQCHG